MTRCRGALILAAAVLGCKFLWTVELPSQAVAMQVHAAARKEEAAQVTGSRDDGVCLSCHQDQAATYPETSHHRTSSLGNRNTILGSFRNDGSNLLMIADPALARDDPGLYFKMDAKDGNYYQTAVAGWPDQLRTRSERFDVVIGTGTRGQSYLYWKSDQLFELPVSYWSEGRRWINSPGFKNGTMNFNRPITPRCLECHASFIQATSPDPQTNRYHRTSLVTGISCERCHGPSENHLRRHVSEGEPRARSEGEAILNPATLSRDRQVDLCALCHNGIRAEERAPAFSYQPGDSLDRYLQPNLADNAEHPDVHGNQVGLLKRSRCYLSSPAMSCSTCHEVQAPEHEASWYSQRCLSCHVMESCGMAKTLGKTIANGCVDCHMPVERTAAFSFDTAGVPVQPTMRSHWIRVPASRDSLSLPHPRAPRGEP